MLTVLAFLWPMMAGNSLAIKVVPGQGCGVSTPIRMVEKPTDGDACAIVLDDEEFNAYKLDKIRGEGL